MVRARVSTRSEVERAANPDGLSAIELPLGFLFPCLPKAPFGAACERERADRDRRLAVAATKAGHSKLRPLTRGRRCGYGGR